MVSIKAVIFDFDGVFTDNSVYVSSDGHEQVACSRADGIGLKMLRQSGVYTAILSTETNSVVSQRASKLETLCFHGVGRKIEKLLEISRSQGFDLNEVVYVGNDLNDLECMAAVGIPIAVADAHPDIKRTAKYVTSERGGSGAVREVCELIASEVLLKAHAGDDLAGRPVAQFPSMSSVGPREWGDELLLVHSIGKYTMKKLVIRAGRKGGLQYHRLKDEASYIISGSMIIRYADSKGILTERLVNQGDFFHFPAGCIHQEEAITDVVRIEVSTPHFNDRVRVEKYFNMDDGSGLPTTSIFDVLVK
jgi:YrbI family 3-deoxy-D-manno-octulosonate 8-phosphate phosphatase